MRHLEPPYGCHMSDWREFCTHSTTSGPTMPAALLTAVDSTDHIHLVIGWNSLAAARCTKSLDVGAKTKVIAPADADLHYGLQNRIDRGQVEWLQRSFCDSDLTQLGRSEIDGVVDAVFVTIGVRDDLSMSSHVH